MSSIHSARQSVKDVCGIYISLGKKKMWHHLSFHWSLECRIVNCENISRKFHSSILRFSETLRYNGLWKIHGQLRSIHAVLGELH